MCGEMGEVMWVARKLNLVLKHLDEMRQKSTPATPLHSPMDSHPVFGKPAPQPGLECSPIYHNAKGTESTGEKQEGHLGSPVPVPVTSTLKMFNHVLAR